MKLCSRAVILALVMSFALSGAANGQGGKIVVTNDAWWTADQFFAESGGSRDFALNIATFFVGNRAGHFLVSPENSLPWLTGSGIRDTMTAAGHTWTNYAEVPGFTLDLATLLTYDAVFITRQYPGDQMTIPDDVLEQYVLAGGNVVAVLGMGLNNDTGVNEAADWNPFLNAFGLQALSPYNGIEGSIPIVSSHPLMNGVDALYQNNGSTLTLTGSDPSAQIIASYQGAGLYAVWEGPTYEFSGFLPPTKNLPELNKARAGKTEILKFSLNGDHGLQILAPGAPVSVPIACTETGEVPIVGATTAPGTLTYDEHTDRYAFQWDTDPKWNDMCRQFIMELRDGSLHRANFAFGR